MVPRNSVGHPALHRFESARFASLDMGLDTFAARQTDGGHVVGCRTAQTTERCSCDKPSAAHCQLRWEAEGDPLLCETGMELPEFRIFRE